MEAEVKSKVLANRLCVRVCECERERQYTVHFAFCLLSIAKFTIDLSDNPSN